MGGEAWARYILLMTRAFILGLVVAMLAGCTETSEDPTPAEIDLSEFEHPPDIYELQLIDVVPDVAADYVEFREQSFPSASSYDVLSAVGDKCATAASPADCLDRLDTITVLTTGFHFTGHPDDHVKYLVVNRGDEVSLVDTSDSVAAFIGAVDSRDEAMLRVAAAGYYWSTTNLATGGIREVADGFEIIATQSELCPASSTAYLLRVTTAGDLEVLLSWTLTSPGNLCS